MSGFPGDREPVFVEADLAGIRIVHRKAESRSLIRAAETIAEEGYKDDTDVSELFDDAEKKIFPRKWRGKWFRRNRKGVFI